MRRELVFTPTASEQYDALSHHPPRRGLLKQVQKTLGLLETNIGHPSLKTHEYHSLEGIRGERVWEAYVQHKTPAAYRVFFHYGPDRVEGDERVPVIMIVAIVRHP